MKTKIEINGSKNNTVQFPSYLSFDQSRVRSDRSLSTLPLRQINAIHARHVDSCMHTCADSHARYTHTYAKALDPPTRGLFVTAMAAIGIFDSTIRAKSRRWRRVCAPLSFYRGTFIRQTFCDSLSPTRRLSFDPHYGTFRSPPFSDLRVPLFVSLSRARARNLVDLLPPQPLLSRTPHFPHTVRLTLSLDFSQLREKLILDYILIKNIFKMREIFDINVFKLN